MEKVIKYDLVRFESTLMVHGKIYCWSCKSNLTDLIIGEVKSDDEEREPGDYREWRFFPETIYVERVRRTLQSYSPALIAEIHEFLQQLTDQYTDHLKVPPRMVSVECKHCHSMYDVPETEVPVNLPEPKKED